MKKSVIEKILKQAALEKRSHLLETEGLALLNELGLRTPKTIFIDRLKISKPINAKIPGTKVVLKVISPTILHKSDVGGVAIVENKPSAIQATLKAMETGLKRQRKDKAILGYTISECIDFESGLRGEILLGCRYTPDFGPVVTVGAGGIFTEFLTKSFQPGKEIAVFSTLDGKNEISRGLDRLPLSKLWLETFRGKKASLAKKDLVDTIDCLLKFANTFVPTLISEFEINPIVITKNGLTALDILVKLGKGTHPYANALTQAQMRPVSKIKNLLSPQSVAVLGVSEKMNPGHIIVNNLLREGFQKSKIYIVKPGSTTPAANIEGCLCVPSIAALPESVDMLILAISANQVPAAIQEAIKNQKAESIVIIPGGLEEKEGSQAVVHAMNQAILAARKTSWGGPVLNGGNCLGIKSIPGKYDTMFIPQYKIGPHRLEADPVAFISQSGALAISRANKLEQVNFRYSISVGNQSDLTIGDYFHFLKNDQNIDVFAVYIEGFKAGDGLHFLKAAKQLVAAGRKVIVYRSGRTAAGAIASASHTASIAGDYAVTRSLCQNAGIILADTLADFDDLIELATQLRKRKLPEQTGHLSPLRLGAVSNAGFECVAIGDNIGSFEMAKWDAKTNLALQKCFERNALSGIVDVHNPLDLTPMANDQTYAETFQAVLDDPNVDIGLVSCIPLTSALNTLAANSGHSEDLNSDNAVASKIFNIWHTTNKPWAVVIDTGTLYDPLAQKLKSKGIPTFRTVDRAMKLLGLIFAAYATWND